jgi:hypothetical protein
MKRVVAVAVTAVLALGAGKALIRPGTVQGDPGPGVNLLAQGGFGDYRNSFAWSMAWFRGKLYVGTGRLVNCVENATVDYYLLVSARYKKRPISGVRCPANKYAMDLRAEIWQYTPGTGRWRLVYQSPVGPNPLARGRHIARDIAFRGMAVYRDARGRKTLYIGDVTADEYIPALHRRHPPRILSTRDGLHFRATPAPKLIERTPNGVQRPMGFRSMAVWRGRLYVTASTNLTGQGAVFQVIRPWSRHARFKQVTPSNLAVFEIQVFDGHLYVGTGDRKNGYGIYKVSATRRYTRGSSGRRRAHRALVHRAHRAVRRAYRALDRARGDRRARRHARRALRRARRTLRRAHYRYAAVRYRVTPIVTGGAGRGATVTSVVSMDVFRNRLYVGASGWYNNQGIPVSEMIRVDRHGRWQIVAGANRVINGVLRGPISGLGDGFFNIFSAHFWRMTDYGGALYVSTNDWSYLVRVAFPGLSPVIAGTIQSALAGEYGFDLWATCDGRDWFPVTRDAFGESNMLDFGGRTLVPAPGGLFVGSANHAQGTKIWRLRVGACNSLTGGARKRYARGHRRRSRAAATAVAAPQELLTDAQRNGNVISWRASAGASQYRVLRAAYLNVPLTLRQPPVLPDGFMMEDQVPDIVPPGTPGSEQVDLPVLQAFTPVGTASRSVFVDRTARRGQRYAYRVVAVGASGYASPASAMQTAPDPRPAPTFEQVIRDIGTTTAARRLAKDVLVQAAGEGRRAKLRTLARLQRSVGPGTDAADVLERLRRQIRYAGLAGGH